LQNLDKEFRHREHNCPHPINRRTKASPNRTESLALLHPKRRRHQTPGRTSTHSPPSCWLYAAAGNRPTGIDNLHRIDPASSLLTQQVPLASLPGAVAYFALTYTDNTPTTVLQYGNNRTLLPGGVSFLMI
jgi:hypothetical protein